MFKHASNVLIGVALTSLAVYFVLIFVQLFIEQEHYELHEVLLSNEAQLFDTLNAVDEYREPYDQYHSIVQALEQGLIKLQQDYDEIPEGTLLYHKMGAFISREEYTNEEWQRIQEGRTTINREMNKTALPEFRRKTVQDRAHAVLKMEPPSPFPDQYQRYLKAKNAMLEKYQRIDSTLEHDVLWDWVMNGLVVLSFSAFAMVYFVDEKPKK